MIIQAAVKFNGGVYTLEKPARDSDINQRFGPLHERKRGDIIEGFIDDNRGFVSRQVALAIVEREDQPLRTGKFMAYGHGLFSEDLW